MRSSNDGFRTIHMGRAVSQAGMRANSWPSALRGLTLGALDEAVVLSVYYPDEDDRPWMDGVQRAITCDIRTVGENPRDMARVPVYQFLQGVQDEDVFVPRPTRIAVDGTTLVTEGSQQQNTTDSNVVDGDHVLVGFLRNDKERAFIFPVGIPHAQSNNYPQRADGRVRRIRHHGTMIEIDSSGNVTIDASNASKEELGAGGALQDDPNGGTITIKAKSGKAVKLDSDLTELSESASQPVVLGNDLQTALNALVDALSAFVVAPTSPQVQAATKLALTAVKTLTYLSSKAKVG